MFETLMRLYTAGKLDNTGLSNAIAKQWITPAQADEIKESKEDG